MRMYDVIQKKRNGEKLTQEEIQFFVRGYTSGEIPDYQVAALLMAIYFQGMDKEETVQLTLAMQHSGDVMDLSKIEGIKVDKHSTGGVGDKTTLIVAPIVASCGVKVAKMSGRGLGHTGGTVDKLESIPGYRTTLSMEEFFEIVNNVGVAVVGQSGDLAPADKKIYALRDVTATVDNVSLIASSIMSKKLAAGADCIVLDVKMGSGAFMKDEEGARALAKCMVEIGEGVGRKTVALLTNMDVPLGELVGNSFEVIEAVETLKGNGPSDLLEVSVALAENMLFLAGKGDLASCRAQVLEAISSGRAFEKLVEMVEAQGGDSSVLYDTTKFRAPRYSREVLAKEDGNIIRIETEKVGMSALVLGAGRAKKEDEINHAVGIKVLKKLGSVRKGEVLGVLYADDEARFDEAERLFFEAYIFGDENKKKVPILIDRISVE